MPYVNTQSTVKLQQVVNLAKAKGDIEPVLNVSGTSASLPLAIATDVMTAIVSRPFPWKWNDVFCPQFVTNSFQQDYAGIFPNGTSMTNLDWLERGIVVDINNTAQPKPFRLVEVGRQLPQGTGTFWNSATNDPLFIVNYFPNISLYYGVWGDTNVGNITFGNNPGPGAIYTNPLGLVNGQAQSMPSNPITQIQDANGNLLVVTTYGICGNTAPLLPALSVPGTTVTDGTTTWTVVDPYGQGFRISPIPSETGVVWQFNLWGQARPIRFTSLQQTLFPLPDYLEPNFRMMFIAQAYRYSPEKSIRAKFQDEWNLALKALDDCRAREDRELEENMFTPDRSIMSTERSRNSWVGPAWPYQYPLR